MLEFQRPPGKPILRGNEHYWQVIRQLDEAGTWTVHEIDLQSRTKARGTITDYVKRLVKAGIAEPTGEMRQHRNMTTPTYRLLKRPVTAPSLKADGTPSHLGRAQAQIWNVMRSPMARHGITVVDLALFASTEVVPIARSTAQRYADRLEAAGYLLVGKASPKTYRLKPDMNTGPKPPAVIEARMIFDRNRGAIVGPMAAEEARS
ncbi:hypothetical protein [Aureimonas sp. SK2]|uniref:hypothetical protein n=1 Tax=Aureimonas sp. SK2 TaxID=3015992 RepID=UPI0024448E07|nr:hypothetical protein [Aureimonas sp. SK2]